MFPGFFFLPFLALVFVLLFFFLILIFALIQVGAISVAFTKLGLSHAQVFWVLVGSLLGSMVNIPIFHRSTPNGVTEAIQEPRGFLDGRHRRLFLRGGAYARQTVAVNLGGCLLPGALSVYFLSRIGISGPLIIALLLVSYCTYKLARPVPGVGIGIPLLIPPLVTVLATWILAPPDQAPQIAYIAGTMGTLIGADVLNLLRPGTWHSLHSPVLSIGGAGTFDGIFLTGILAVLLA